MSFLILGPSPKRLDLQGIRGLAILSVLGLHFLPKYFPNGYLGVDQFFVLSGFLMCMLLEKSSKSPTFSVSHFIFGFYQRRLKRILPLYFLVLSVSLIGLFLFFPDTSYESNLKSGERAVLFLSNREKTKGEDYFSMLSIAIDIFTHTWSLLIEVQFYLMIPILYLLLIQFTPSKVQSLSLLALGSYLYSTVYCNKQKAFNSLVARMWQFIIGMIVNIISEREVKIRRNEKIAKYFCLISMLCIGGFPKLLPETVLRPFFTISTGILILLSSGDTILSFPILTYIGDISYSLYLIHWPFYAYWKLVLSSGSVMNWYLMTVFMISVLLAVISYEFYEKWYLKLPNNSLALLFSSSICLLEYNRIEDYLSSPAVGSRLDGLDKNEIFSFDEVSKIHRKWSLNDYRNLYAPTCEYSEGDGPLGFCRHTGLDEDNGKHKFMLLGNSWAANHARIFYDECKGKAKSIAQFSDAGCDPLEAHQYHVEICITDLDNYVEQVKKEKPDYLFLLSRMIDIGDPLPQNITNLEDDPIFQSMRYQLHRILKHVKKRVFILNALPDIDGTKIAEIPGKMKNEEDLVEFDRSMITVNASLARRRYRKLLSECPRCVLIDYAPLFYRNSTKSWRFYDVEQNGLSYLTSEKHLSYHGLELVRHIYTGICNRL